MPDGRRQLRERANGKMLNNSKNSAYIITIVEIHDIIVLRT